MTLNPKLTCPHCHQPIPQASGIVADPIIRTLAFKNRLAHFTPTEWEIVALLLSRFERSTLAEALLNQIYQLRPECDIPENADACLKTLICCIRKKLFPLGLDIPKHNGRRKIGYVLRLMPQWGAPPAGPVEELHSEVTLL